MGIKQHKRRLVFEEWVPKSASALAGTDTERGAHAIAVHVPERGKYNGTEIGGSIAIEVFSDGDTLEEMEDDGDVLSVWDGDETVLLSPDGARALAATLVRCADAADAFRANPDSATTRFTVVCDECDETMPDADRARGMFISRDDAAKKAHSYGWLLTANDGALCEDCRSQSDGDDEAETT